MLKGYEQTKIIDIANAAGIGKGTVYEYFDSKESIFTALCYQQLGFYKEQAIRSQAQCNGKGWHTHLKSFLTLEIDSLSQGLRQAFQHLSDFSDSDTFDPEDISSNPVLMFHLEMLKSKACRKPFLELTNFRYRLLESIIKSGIKAGEFRCASTKSICISLLGAIMNFTVLQSPFHPLLIFPESQRFHCDTEDYVQFLLDSVLV